jgi:hypothetical protein
MVLDFLRDGFLEFTDWDLKEVTDLANLFSFLFFKDLS